MKANSHFVLAIRFFCFISYAQITEHGVLLNIVMEPTKHTAPLSTKAFFSFKIEPAFLKAKGFCGLELVGELKELLAMINKQLHAHGAWLPGNNTPLLKN